MSARTRIALLVGLLWLWPTICQAQLVLVGCTANITSTSGTSQIVDIDPLTGAATNPRDTGIFVLGGIATQPSTGTLFGLTTLPSSPPNSLVTINPWTGIATVVGSTGLPSIVEGDLAFNPINGMLYGLQDGGPVFAQRNFFQINPTTGAATVIANLGTSGDYSALAFDPNGMLFAIDSGVSGNSLLQRLDPNTGAIVNTVTMNVNLVSGVGMTFDPSSGVAYVADGGQELGIRLFYQLDTNSGVLTSIGPTGIPGGIAGLSFVSVPEPSSMFLVAIGALFVTKRIRARTISERKADSQDALSD